MTRPLLLSFLIVTAAVRGLAQQVECALQVNYEAVATTNKDLLENFERDIRTYINDYSWGPEQLDEKIQCTISIFIKSVIGDNRYSAQAFIGSQRNVFGTNRSTPVIRLFDDTWEFTYLKTRPLNHNLLQFDDLTSFIDFYVHIIIGSDYDTFEPSGGTPFFRTAADIANLGRSSSAKGWDVKAGSFSRIQLVDEILSPKYEQVRSATYAYHFTGLDSLNAAPARAWTNIVAALDTMGKVRRQVDPRNLYLKAFFEAKYKEIAELFQQYPDRTIYDRLTRIDPTHATTYDEAKNRAR